MGKWRGLNFFAKKIKKVLTSIEKGSIIYLADALKESQPGTDKVPLES